MSADDLDRPLGYAPPSQTAPRQWRERDIPLRAVALSGIGVIAVSILAFIFVTDRVAAPLPTPPLAASVDYAPPRRISVPDLPGIASQNIEEYRVVSVSPGVRIISPTVDQDAGVKVIRRNGSESAEPIVIRVPQDMRSGTVLAGAPDSRLMTSGPHGPLPRIGRDGARPADVYARPSGLDARLAPGAPRLALVVTGMGINPQASAQTAKVLPGAITFAFSPYAPRVEEQADQARIAGHELLLQVPMEGFAPSPELGARPLMATAARERNLDALHWHMSRFQGYIGLSHFLGGRFMASPQALMPILQDIAGRGLVFFDDGSSRQSLSSAMALATGAPAMRADIAIDTISPDSVDASLRRLEAIAREKGAAIGVVPAVPVHIDRIARFAQGLDARGIALVPLSALIPAPAQTVAR